LVLVSPKLMHISPCIYYFPFPGSQTEALNARLTAGTKPALLVTEGEMVTGETGTSTDEIGIWTGEIETEISTDEIVVVVATTAVTIVTETVGS